MSIRLGLIFCAAVLVAGCYSTNVPNGSLHCSADGRCPEGMHCALGNTCWKNGQDPSGGNMTGTAHKGLGSVSGAVTATSPHYKVIMSTGDSPGGGGTAASATQTVRTGLIGSTQKK